MSEYNTFTLVNVIHSLMPSALLFDSVQCTQQKYHITTAHFCHRKKILIKRVVTNEIPLLLTVCYCSSQRQPLFIVVPLAVYEPPSQHWTKRVKIVPWYCTWLKNRLPDTFETASFPAKVYLCTLAQWCTNNFIVYIMLFQMYFGNID